MFFVRQLTDAEKAEALNFLRLVKPDSEVLRLFTSPPLLLTRADERLKARGK